MEGGRMVAKGNRDAPKLEGLAQSVDPAPGDGGNNAAAAPAPPVPARRMPHLHKLEKKLSSSDLHSRLKTRKVLGVGETDDGDIHRSKLSQILGHSDQLYVRLPWGLRVWQFVLAVSFTVASLWALLFPSQIFDVTLEEEEAKYVTLPVRLYGTALLALSLFHWNTLHATDRDVIRVALLSSVIYFSLQTVVTLLTMATWTRTSDHDYTWLLVSRLTASLIGALYYHAVGCKTVSLKPKPTGMDSSD